MDDLEKYLDLLFGGQEGYVYCPVKRNTFEQKFFKWPTDSTQLQDWIKTSDLDASSHVYISPAIYSEPVARKTSIKGIQCVWVEFDGQERIEFQSIPIPTGIVQTSSSTHLHCYWRVDFSSKEVIEDVNRRLTYFLNADTSGWDSTQLLRPPTTTNRKHDLPVVLASYNISHFSLDLFDAAPSVSNPSLEAYNSSALINYKTLLKGREFSNKLLLMIKSEIPPVGSRSQFLVKLAFELAEEGLNSLEIVSLLHHVDERVQKYSGRNDQLDRLTQIAELALHKTLIEESVTLLSYDDILNKTRKLEWILDPWLHRTGLLIISGAPNVGKTQLGLQLTSQLSLGENFLGKILATSELHSIFCMSLEMPREGLNYIIERQKKELSSSPINFHFIDEETTFTQYENFIEQTGASVVLIDSLKELMDSSDSDSAIIRAQQVLKWLKKIRRRYDCAVILIHHNRKATEGNKKPKTLHDLAESYRIGADSDTVVQLWEDAKGIEVSLVKCRYGPKEAFYTRRNPDTLWYSRVDGESGNNSGFRVSRRQDVSDQSEQTNPSINAEISRPTEGLRLNATFGLEPVQSDQEGTGNLNLGFT